MVVIVELRELLVLEEEVMVQQLIIPHLQTVRQVLLTLVVEAEEAADMVV